MTTKDKTPQMAYNKAKSLRDSGLSLKSIAEALSRQGYPNPYGTAKTSGWSPDQVDQLMEDRDPDKVNAAELVEKCLGMGKKPEKPPVTKAQPKQAPQIEEQKRKAVPPERKPKTKTLDEASVPDILKMLQERVEVRAEWLRKNIKHLDEEKQRQEQELKGLTTGLDGIAAMGKALVEAGV